MLGCVAQWRLRRVHHSDTAVDSTTDVRFHPIEILLSILYKMWWVVCIGAPPAAILAWEVLLNAWSLFKHGNVRLACVGRVLRRLLVTPDMHRVHHSVHRDETDSNYGFTLSVSDRLLGTDRASPKDGHEKMTLGLPEFRGARDQRLHRLLLQPVSADEGHDGRSRRVRKDLSGSSRGSPDAR
jgi:sterol desaturase/sphingolipid hydroxylase (fatty acid hydroxylase superfamily)